MEVGFYLHLLNLLLRFSSSSSILRQAKQIHAQIQGKNIRGNDVLNARLAAVYCAAADLRSAEDILRRCPSPLLFNAVIRGHTIHSYYSRAIKLFAQMRDVAFTPDQFTFPFVLKSCAELEDLAIGEAVHSQCIRSGFRRDLYVGGSLVNVYAKCGDLTGARQVFDEMTERHASSWNSLIAGYMKDGSFMVARKLFDEMPSRNVLSWTAMISGYCQNGLADCALGLFEEMMRDDAEVKPNWVTVVSVLPACAHSAALEQGEKVHQYASSMGFDRHPTVQIAIVGMYAKCGNLVKARECFGRIRERDKSVVAWNTMITAYASHGLGEEVTSTFEDMVRSGVQPDAITFTGLLSGCSHSGLVEKGLKYFKGMKSIYFVEPMSEHYACVVDLYARAGHLAKAMEIVDQMEIEAGPSVWGALLAACRTHNNLDIAEIAAKKLFVLEPHNSGNFVLLSNMYAKAGKWEEVKKLRSSQKIRGVKKSPGCSWTEIDGRVHAFLGGDRSHPQSTDIHVFLEDLRKKMRATGYMPDISYDLHDVSQEEKEFSLATHSEKLAVAFGLINTHPGSVLRVTKNLRICGDCHTAMQFISCIYNREIIVRDVNRFHHFQSGICSCGDYW